MVSNIEPLFGGPVAGEIDPELIEQTERFMQAVRRGEVRSFAITYVRPNGHPSQSFKYTPETFYALYSGVAAMLNGLTQILDENWQMAKEREE